MDTIMSELDMKSDMNSDNEIIIMTSKHELMGQGYLYANVGKEFVYEGHSFILKQHGIRQLPTIPFMGYSHVVIPRKPIWIVSFKDLQLTITDIK
jgi:hypothetical protein